MESTEIIWDRKNVELDGEIHVGHREAIGTPFFKTLCGLRYEDDMDTEALNQETFSGKVVHK
ncbi:MAG: hypothetical protein E3J35_09990 [Methanomassiliicoccales archaeon]|nr:MAG: hypothetical protein E3J35_09990 [Methanomassiliicoccales archaeon]